VETEAAKEFEIAGLIAATALVLLCHLFLPNRQRLPMTWMDPLPTWKRPFPLILEGVLVAGSLLAIARFVLGWRPGWLRHYLPLFTAAVVTVGVWDGVTQKLNWMRLPYFPGPDLVFGAMVEDAALLVESAWRSLVLLLSGYSVGVILGMTSGVLIGWFPHVRYWGMPIVKIVGPLPATALIPLAMVLSDNSFISAASLIAFATWFPVTMLTASGIANVRHAHLDVARTLGAGPAYLIWHVAIPSALPNMFIGLFMGLAASFLTLSVAEGVGVQAGLGYYLRWRQGAGMEYANVYAALLLMSAFFSSLMTALFLVRDRVLAWQKGVIRW